MGAGADGARLRRGSGSRLWLAPALLAGLGVWLMNGAVLFYFDSPAYLAQGERILQLLGLPPGGGGGTAGAGGVAADAGDGLVNATRSTVYALAVAALARLGGGGAIVAANLALTLLAAWLAIRVLAREAGTCRPGGRLLGVPLLAASAGALPFYIAYVMPDIFTPVLLIVTALLAVLARRMSFFEILLAASLGILAVLSHVSHIPIVAALLPAVALAARLGGRARWGLAPGLVALILLAGLAERQAFRAAAKSVAGAEAIYYPFLTARLIEDGPGWRYLNAKCPDPELATCALHAVLMRSDDPYRLTASHIIFQRREDLGSFQLLPPEEQARVARAQYRFFVRVFLWAPVSTSLAVVRNTLQQAVMNDVGMTVPDEAVLASVPERMSAVEFGPGRLGVSRGWLGVLEPVHGTVYALSLAVILWLVAMPGRLAGALRGFAAMLLLGILANAFVTGAVSQPADRYGARVIWLLPWLAALLWMLRERRQDV